ncbi:MAG: glycosyltransferase family 2 protein [Arachnia sp.]
MTVAIPTFRRPVTLDRLLENVGRQAATLDDVTGGRTEILVVDNDPEGSARVVVESRPGVRYKQIFTPGIAAVRSACLAAATGDILQFIDDDEQPESNWLMTMVNSWLDLGKPTALAGSVLTKFDTPPSPWVAAGGFFERRRPPTGTVLPVAPAGNLLLNLPEVRRLGTTFDERLGLRGGEDTLFTKQLTAAGGLIRFCREGVVYDLIPDERNTRRWVLRRAWHHGSTTSVVALWDTYGWRRRQTQGRLMMGGLGRYAAGIAGAAFGRIIGSVELQARGLRLAHRGLGVLSGSLRQGPGEYARVDGEETRPLNGPIFAARLQTALRKSKADSEFDLGIVVVNYGSSALLKENLPSSLTKDSAAQIVVVDNLSSGLERSKMRALAVARGWAMVEPDGNLGFGDGVNAGVLRAAQMGCGTFLTLNPDACAEAHVLEALAETARRQPKALVSPMIVDSDGKSRFRGSTVSMRTGRMRSGWVPCDADPEWKNWLTGACLAFSGEAFVRLGGFAAGYFLYWEDVDLSRRAANLGMTLVLRDDLLVVHDEGGTHTEPGSRSRSPLYYYYNTRNRLVFGARLAPRANRAAWLLATPRESIMIWLRGGRKQLFTEPAGAVEAVRGSLDGLVAFRSNVDHLP